MIYRWVVWLHVAGAFLFFMTHGASVWVSFQLRRERNPDRIKALLELSANSIRSMYYALGVLLAGGIVAGFIGDWWSYGWIWIALILLLVITGLMYPLAAVYYRKVRMLVIKMKPDTPVPAELEQLLQSSRPWLLAFVGVGGLLVILYLMMFKPF